MKTLIYLFVLLSFALPNVQASEININSDVKRQGLTFWRALANLETNKMKSFYSSEVILIAGSELLRKKYGINPSGNRKNHFKLSKEQIIKGYENMINDIDSNKWKIAFSKINLDKIIFQSAREYEKHFGELKTDDMMMIVSYPAPSDEKLYFIFSKKQDNTWLITHEATDY